MHLSYSTSKYKGKVYKSYSIAKSYRDGKTSKKEIIWPIGKLTDLEAQQISLICKTISGTDQILTSLRDVVVKESKPYGDIAIANAIWERWKLSKAFEINTTSELSTNIVAKVLTLNRCIAPCSHYSIPRWVNEKDLGRLNDDKIYYELDKIGQNQESMENHLFEITYREDKKSYDYVNYDLSSSYFVGFKCSLSQYGKSKDDKPNNKQVLLGILVNDKGYPFKWDVYPGNMSEIDTLVDNVDACVKRFKLKNINMVFDRGIVSDGNLTYINNESLKYISALDKDQIPNIPSVDLSVFTGVTIENYKEYLPGLGFKQYDGSLFYQDLGEIDHQRYILGFNPALYKEDRKCRDEKIAYFENFLEKKNGELRNAKRSRKRESTRQIIFNELKRLKINKYFQDPILKAIQVEQKNKKGEMRTVKPFKITIRKKDNIIADWEKLDGVCVFISNHTGKTDNEYRFPAEKIINAYREKTKIEDVFKHIKAFLKIRPFNVNTESHVRAVYSICVFSYFINKDLAERRRKIEGIDCLNSKRLYEPFRKYHYMKVADEKYSKIKMGPMEFSPETKKYIISLGLKDLAK